MTHTAVVIIYTSFRLSKIIEERSPVWRESGQSFVESVSTLLERLLEYKNALEVIRRYPRYWNSPSNPFLFLHRMALVSKCRASSTFWSTTDQNGIAKSSFYVTSTNSTTFIFPWRTLSRLASHSSSTPTT